jgi:hypothetical protein
VVEFDGEDVGLSKAAGKAATDLDGVDTSARKAGDGVSTASSKMATLGAVGLGGISTVVGFTSAMDGWGQVMNGNVAGGIQNMVDGAASMGAGMTLLISAIPEQVTTWVVGHATMAASALASFASQIAEWAVLAATSLVSAASVALAWLISVAPIIIVIALVVALVVVIIKNWDTIKRVVEAGARFISDVAVAAWHWIVSTAEAAWRSVVDTVNAQIDLVLGIFRGLGSLIGTAMSSVAEAITAPFRVAFQGLKTLWNNTVGGFGFTLPTWIPGGIGGKGFSIPKMAAGGIVTSPTLALIGEAGPEAVIPLGAGGGGIGGADMVHVQLVIDGQVLIDAVRKAVRNRGGSVQGVLG